jgi:hypothetical protein
VSCQLGTATLTSLPAAPASDARGALRSATGITTIAVRTIEAITAQVGALPLFVLEAEVPEFPQTAARWAEAHGAALLEPALR